MASTKDLTVRLIGKDEGALNALTSLGKKSDEAATKSAGLGKMASTAMIGIGAAAGAMALKSVKTFEDVGTQVMRLQRVTGDTAEEASKLRFAMKMSGVDVEGATKSMTKMANTLQKAPDSLDKFGISAKDSTGQLRPMKDILLDVSEKMKNTSNAGERVALAQQLMGKSGADMIPFLIKGKDGIEQLMGSASQYGEVLSGPQLDAVKANKMAHRELDAALEGLQIKIGSAVMPVMTQFTGVLSRIPGPIMDIAGPVVAVGGGLLGVTGIAMKSLPAIKGMASGFTAAAEGLGTMVRSLGSVGGALRGVSFAGAAAGVALFTYQLQKNADESKRWASDQGGGGTIPEQIERTKAALKEGEDELKRYGSLDFGDTLHLFGSNEGRAQADKVKALKDQLQGLEDQQKKNGDATDLQKRGLDEFGNQLDETANGVDGLSSAEAKNEAEAKAVAAAHDKALSSLKAYFDEAAGRVDTERALAQAHDDLSRSIAENGVHFDNMTQQGRDNRKAFEDAGKAAVDWGISQIEAGASADAATFGVNLQIESLRKQMYAAGFSKVAVDNYITSLKLTPTDVSTAFHAPGLMDVWYYTVDLGNRLNDIGAKFPAAQAGVNAVLHRNKPIGAASGAGFKARPGGHMVNVAEGGEDEVVAPQRMIAEAVRAGGGGTGGVVININAGALVHSNDIPEMVRNGVIAARRRTGESVEAFFGG